MKKTMFYLAAAAMIAGLSGCSSMSMTDQMKYNELRSYGINVQDCPNHKSPAIAGVCQILPGIGNFYLASGTDSSEQIAPGVLNIVPGWLIWPVGCLWAIPEGVIDAETINKKQAVYYYSFDPTGVRELQKLKKIQQQANN